MDYICLFSKPPIPGRTKTRLAKAIGTEAAARLTGAMLQDICAVILQVKHAVPQLWYPPDTSPKDFERVVPSEFTFHPQRGTNLGERMSMTFAYLLQNVSENRAIIIGSDCITHTPDSLCAALRDLNSHRVVIQPSEDGGYVLVGQSSWYPDIFNNIKWGHEDVYAHSINTMRCSGVQHKELSVTFDVDSKDDLMKITNFVGTTQRRHVELWLNSCGNRYNQALF